MHVFTIKKVTSAQTMECLGMFYNMQNIPNYSKCRLESLSSKYLTHTFLRRLSLQNVLNPYSIMIIDSGITCKWFYWMMLAIQFCVRKYWNLKPICTNWRDTFKNYCTDTGLVCTYFNVFVVLNPNMAMKIWISIFS